MQEVFIIYRVNDGWETKYHHVAEVERNECVIVGVASNESAILKCIKESCRPNDLESVENAYDNRMNGYYGNITFLCATIPALCCKETFKGMQRPAKKVYFVVTRASFFEK